MRPGFSSGGRGVGGWGCRPICLRRLNAMSRLGVARRQQDDFMAHVRSSTAVPPQVKQSDGSASKAGPRRYSGHPPNCRDEGDDKRPRKEHKAQARDQGVSRRGSALAADLRLYRPSIFCIADATCGLPLPVRCPRAANSVAIFRIPLCSSCVLL